MDRVLKMGNEIYGARQWSVSPREGFRVPIFDREVGRVSGLPFDKSVRDLGGNIIGELHQLDSSLYSVSGVLNPELSEMGL